MHNAHKGSPHQKDIENALAQLRGVMLYDTNVQPVQQPEKAIQSVQPMQPIRAVQPGTRPVVLV